MKHASTTTLATEIPFHKPTNYDTIRPTFISSSFPKLCSQDAFNISDDHPL